MHQSLRWRIKRLDVGAFIRGTCTKKESKFSSGRSDKTIKIACADYFILIQLLHSIGHNDRKMKWVMSSQHSPMYSPNREM